MANPFDQFDASTAPAASANPFDQFDKGGVKTAPVQKSDAYQPTWLDKLTNVANPTLGLGDILTSGVGQGIAALGGKNLMPSVAQSRAERGQQASELGPVTSTAAQIAGYGPMGAVLGPGNTFTGASGLTAGLVGRPIAQGAAEGALAGGISNLDPSDPINSAGEGALGGAVLGGAAGGIGKGIARLTAKPGAIDPEAAIAATKAAREDAYGALTKAPANPGSVDGVIGRVMNGLDPSVETGMSPGLRSTVNNIRSTVQGLDQANMGQVDSWQRQINAAAQREGHPTDAIVASQIDSGLSGLIQSGGAGDLQQAAQAAHQNHAMAQNLAEWQRTNAAGAPIGQAPLTEAERYYQTQPAMYDALVNLYKKNQTQNDPSWALGHLAAGAIGDVGGAMFGFPGHFGGELLGYLGVKPAIKGAMKGVKQNATGKAIQQLYPQMTGQQLSGGQDGYQVGDAIKNIMLGAVY